MREMEKWTNSKGNVCFRFPMRKTFERPWIIITAVVLAAVTCSVEFFVWDSYRLLAPVSFVLFVFFLWWTDIPTRGNEAVISNVVHEIMDNMVNEDAKAAGSKVVKSLVNHDSKGTYGIVEASCFLVLLDNEEVWEYPLIYHKSKKKGAYFECERNHIVSKNQKHIRSINPKRWRRFIESLKMSENATLWALLSAIVIIGGLSFAGFCWMMERYNWWLLLIFIDYLCIYSLSEWQYSKCPNKLLNVIRWVVTIPFAVLYIIFHTGLPFITIVGTYFFVALFAFGLPAIILTGLSHVGWLDFKPETIAFIVFTLGSLLCSNSYRATKCMIRYSPLRDWGNHEYESYKERLAIYLIHPSNVIFILYFVYLVYLAVSGYLQIEKGVYLVSEGLDSAILKAFLVFIAFTNMKVKAKVAEVEAKEVFRKTMGLFVHDK